MQPPREVPAAGPSRRRVLRLAGRAGLAVAGAVVGAGCSAADREALRAVDVRQVRLDEEVVPLPEPPGPTARELRRRAVRAGSVAALAAYQGAGEAVAPAGRTGGTADRAALLEVHRVHVGVLAGSAAASAAASPGASDPASPGASDPASPGASAAPAPAAPASSSGRPGAGLLPRGPAPDVGGPTVAPEARPVAVLRTGQAAAVRACLEELAEDDALLSLARLHARVAAARGAQAAGLAGDGATALVWPTTATGQPVADALQALLAQEHRARWSYAVVLAWSTDRTADAEAALADHTRRTVQLADLVRLLGAEPVAARPTYPTDDAGTPVDGPVTAAALALRLEDAVAAAAAGVLDAAVEDGAGPWVRAAVRSSAEAERARWSWGGAPVPWPGGPA